MTTRDILMRESPGDGTEDGVNEGIRSFFHSGKNPEKLARLEFSTRCGMEPRSAESYEMMKRGYTEWFTRLPARSIKFDGNRDNKPKHTGTNDCVHTSQSHRNAIVIDTKFYDGKCSSHFTDQELIDSLVVTADGDELVEDTSWSRTKRGPSLAELLQRVEVRIGSSLCYACFFLDPASAVRHVLLPRGALLFGNTFLPVLS